MCLIECEFHEKIAGAVETEQRTRLYFFAQILRGKNLHAEMQGQRDAFFLQRLLKLRKYMLQVNKIKVFKSQIYRNRKQFKMLRIKSLQPF